MINKGGAITSKSSTSSTNPAYISALSSPLKKAIKWKRKLSLFSTSSSTVSESPIPFFYPEDDPEPVTPCRENNQMFLISSRDLIEQFNYTPLTEINDSPFFNKLRNTADRGPKVKGFLFTQTQSTASKPHPEDVCFLCEELLQNKFDNEDLVQFKCGDFMHDSCFRLQIEFEIDSLKSIDRFNAVFNNSKVFEALSVCKGRMCIEKGQQEPLVPLDGEFREKISLELLSKSAKVTQRQDMFTDCTQNFSVAPAYVTLAAKRLQIVQDTKMEDINKPTNQLISVAGSTEQLFVLNEVLTPLLPSLHLDSPCPIPDIANTSSTNPKLCGSPGIARVTDSPVRALFSSESVEIFTRDELRKDTTDIRSRSLRKSYTKIKAYKNVLEDELRTSFILFLLANSPGFSLSNLLRMGNLRLVDHLLVSTDNKSYEHKVGYLFENYLILLGESKEPLREIPLRNIKVSTPDISTMKLTGTKNDIFQLFLRSQMPCIIEKWGAALSDTTFNFPVDIMTSTFMLPGLEYTVLSRVPSLHSMASSTESSSEHDQVLVPLPIVEINLHSSTTTLNMKGDEKTPIDSTSQTPSGTPSETPSGTPSLSSEDCESDSDEDSDNELIELALKSKVPEKRIDSLFKGGLDPLPQLVLPKSPSKDWSSLIMHVDHAIANY